MRICRKFQSGQEKQYLASSLFSATLGAHDPGHYRSTLTGAPNVAALVRPGMQVRTSYGTGGVVVEVIGPRTHVAKDGREFPHFTIVYVPVARFGQHSPSDRCWINECVAVHGRILKLLEASTDEVFLDGFAPNPA